MFAPTSVLLLVGVILGGVEDFVAPDIESIHTGDPVDDVHLPIADCDETTGEDCCPTRNTGLMGDVDKMLLDCLKTD